MRQKIQPGFRMGVLGATVHKFRKIAVLVLVLIMTGAGARGTAGHPPGRFVNVQGARLWTEIEGQGEPLLLIAGGPGMSHDYFHPYVDGLARSFRVIYFDAYGRGRSESTRAPGAYTFARDVEDIEGLRKALGLSRINLLGHSYGALVAQAYGAMHAATTGKLILVNGIFSGKMLQANNDRLNQEIRKQLPDAWARIQEVRARGLRSSSAEHQSVYGVPHGLYFHHDDPAYRSLPLLVEPSVYYSILGEDADFVIRKDVASLDFRPALKSLGTPILILAGRFDQISLPEFSQQTKKVLPQAEVVVFQKSGHFVLIEENQRAVETIRKFLLK
jgi:proline iminopeptidase